MNNEERKDFWDKLLTLNSNSSQEEVKELFNLIKYPKLLCRYRPVNVRSIEALQSNKLFWSSAYHYDDPFDTYLHVDWQRIVDALQGFDTSSPKALEMLKRACEQFQVAPTEEFQQVFRSLTTQDLLTVAIKTLTEKVRPEMQKHAYSICFSEEPLNETLWLKYADNHKGFCLVYDTSEMLEKYRCGKEEKCAKCPSGGSNSLYPIYYSDEKYDATNYAFSQSIFSFISNNPDNQQSIQNYIVKNPMLWESERVSLIKKKCHEYDAEWRIISHNHFAQGLFIKWIPSKVIIGLKTERAEMAVIVRAAVAAGIEKIYKADISPSDDLDAYELSKEEIEKIINDK